MNCPACGLDIDEHPANRCLDAWVAEEVVGLNVVSRNWRCGQMPDAGYEAAIYAEEPKYGWGFYNEEGPVYWEDVHDVGWGWPPWVDEDHGDLVACVEPVPFYSTDITAAWRVIEKCLPAYRAPEWGKYIHNPLGILRLSHMKEGQATLAICRAALKVVSDE